MTKQELFTKVSSHLRQQRSRSVMTRPGRGSGVIVACAYRGEDGKKCALGILIPDDKYNPDIEGARGSDVIKNYTEIKKPSKGLLRLADALQAIHDTIEPTSWGDALRALAISHGLKTHN